jgi:O-antigen ligase
MKLAKEHFYTGVGTGDVKWSFKEAYEAYPIYIAPEYRHRAHNQYITFLVTFGILGLLYFLLFLAKMLLYWRNYPLALFFVVVAMISFFSEDTLETQAGVTFFSFFVGLFSAVYKTNGIPNLRR